MPQPLLYLAPLKGITDHVFRRTYATNFSGLDLAIAPFISSKQDHIFKPKYIRDLLPANNPTEGLSVIPQIMSKDAADFCALANYIMYETGYETVNWNLGCPFPMVAKKKRGCGMMPETDAIKRFLDLALPALRPELSIKLRLGWQTMDDILRLIPILNAYPLAEVILHPRTGLQRYEGNVDLAAFEQCLALINHRVIYNGDIRNGSDFLRLQTRFPGVRGWMIGRGCVANPFLPEEICGQSRADNNRRSRMKAYHGALFEAYGQMLHGPSHLLNKMKGFWRYFGQLFVEGEKSIKNIRKTRTPEHYLALANRFFDTHTPLEQLPSSLPQLIS